MLTSRNIDIYQGVKITFSLFLMIKGRCSAVSSEEVKITLWENRVEGTC
jgi:hypothetical protein